MRRALLFYFGTKEGAVVPWQFSGINTQSQILKPIEDLIKINTIASDKIEVPIGESAAEYVLFSWDLSRIEHTTLVKKIPKPGIVLALHKSIQDKENRAYSLKYFVVNQKDPYYAEVRESFLHGEKGKFVPREHDVFISYATEDSVFAKKIMRRFEKLEISCFMAEKSTASGIDWQDGLRLTLADVLAAIILITPNSIKSKWVMYETGALWVLDKPIFPAFVNKLPADLPEVITSRQAIDIAIESNIRKLCDDVLEYLEPTLRNYMDN